MRPAAPDILVDFDGTACPADVANELLARFGQPGWEAHDVAVAEGRQTVRAAIDAQAGMLEASREAMWRYVSSNFAVDPGFVSFHRWARSRGHRVLVVSDGFGFYVRPLLEAAGLEGVEVLTNRLVRRRRRWALEHPFEHGTCIGCGTCKVNSVMASRAASGGVAFIGNGSSDRFAVHYTDAVFARDALAEICRTQGIAFFRWESFQDVRRVLSRPWAPLRRSDPPRCPGWLPGVPT